MINRFQFSEEHTREILKKLKKRIIYNTINLKPSTMKLLNLTVMKQQMKELLIKISLRQNVKSQNYSPTITRSCMVTKRVSEVHFYYNTMRSRKH